jgi:hypothetical protein
LDHNVPGGKLNRGLSVVDSAEILKGSALTDDEYTKAAILGWCIELVRDFPSSLYLYSVDQECPLASSTFPSVG